MRSSDMLILIEWHRNIYVQSVACIVKHEDPQINSVRGRPKVEADVLYICRLARLQIDENTESLKL